MRTMLFSTLSSEFALHLISLLSMWSNYWDWICFLIFILSLLNGRWSSRLYTDSPAQRRSTCSRCMQLSSSIWCCKRQLYSSSTSAQRSSRASQQCSRSVSIHSLLQQDRRIIHPNTLTLSVCHGFSLSGQFSNRQAEFEPEWDLVYPERVITDHSKLLFGCSH